MSRLISNSSDCLKSELDLFYVPPTNTSIESGGWSQHYPIAIIDNGPIEFNISGTENEYIHLNKTALYLSISIYKNDNGSLVKMNSSDSVGPVNNLAHSLFSQVDVSLNNESIESSNKTYAYKAYITDLLNYGEDAKTSSLQTALFYKDTSGLMDSLEIEQRTTNDQKLTPIALNHGLIQRRNVLLKGNGTVDLITKIHSDIFSSDRYLLNNVDINIKYIRNSDAFCLLNNDKDKSYTIRIDNAILLLRKAKISPSILLAHSLALEKATAKYPLKRVIVNSYTITKDVQNFTTPSLTTSVLPLRVIVGMVDSEAFNGSESKNPFNFQHFRLRQINLSVDSKNIPYYKGLELDFTNNKYIRGYYSLFEGIDRPVYINGNDISRTDYLNGYTLFAFDISPDLCSAEHFNVLKTGNLILDLSFDTNLQKSITLLVYMEFDNMIEINKSRKVFKDYQI